MSAFLVLMALWVATPKVYIHNLLHHDHSSIDINAGETKIKSQSSDDCDFEKYEKPVYFNIFKFIFSFIPLRPQSDVSASENSSGISSISYAISLLRAPPIGK